MLSKLAKGWHAYVITIKGNKVAENLVIKLVK
jgi:hypothetical protein